MAGDGGAVARERVRDAIANRGAPDARGADASAHPAMARADRGVGAAHRAARGACGAPVNCAGEAVRMPRVASALRDRPLRELPESSAEWRAIFTLTPSRWESPRPAGDP